jgi:hypothetical protein
MSSLGEVKDLSSTAAVMLKTSIFAAWAQFQTASVRQPYLADVIRPHLPLLCPFWCTSLREYARVRITDSDSSSSSSSRLNSSGGGGGGGNGNGGGVGASFDSVYSGLSRETALPVSVRGGSLPSLSIESRWQQQLILLSLCLVLRTSLASNSTCSCYSAQKFRPSHASSYGWKHFE